MKAPGEALGARPPRCPAAHTTLLLALGLGLAGCAETGLPRGGDGSVTLRTVPTAPEYVSGGSALVRLEPAPGVDAEGISLQVDGREVTEPLRPAPPDPLGREGTALLAVVTGLAEGDNEVVALRDGHPVATLTVTNYPSTGPIFSGAHLEPYFCIGQLQPEEDGQPRTFAVGNGDEIAEADPDAGCAIPTRVDYLYMPVAPGEGESEDGEDVEFQPLEGVESLSSLPEDVAEVSTSLGETVPFVIRLETGSVNRAIYQTATLVDPRNPNPDPWTRPRGWNGRLIYTFGGGCEAGFFQGTRTGGVLRDDLLARGYAVASSTLNVNAQGGCNDPLSAETAMMVKEIFAERYGPPVHTIGLGASGGAMQQLLIAGAYPGILDGILPSATFPDAITYFIDTPECRLLLRRYKDENGVDEETMRAVGGWATWQTCENSLGPRPSRIGPGDCPGPIPIEARYDAVENPDGVRCSIYDAMRGVFGTAHYDEISPTPVQPFGRSPHDNVGVQYGLIALNEGMISKDFFLDLNENIGGWDIDLNWTPERTEADPDVVRIAYETGRITSGEGGLGEIPILDQRGYVDLASNFHASYYSFVTRARLIRDNGHADNYVLQRRGRGLSLTDDHIAAMDEWLTNIALDTGGGTNAEKVVRNKPEDLVDSCFDPDGRQIVEPQTFKEDRLFDNTEGRCNTLFPIHAGPRMIAGGPLTNDVLKCQLEAPAREDYEVEFTEAEWSRVQEIFPDGVCDWSRPGVGMDVEQRTWVSFGPSPINRFDPGT